MSFHDDPLPDLDTLGRDLLATSWARRTFVLAAPFVSAALFVAGAYFGHPFVAVVATGLVTFFTYGTGSHDLVHRSLGLPRGINEVFLSVIELLALRSGHAYRLAHLHHHRHLSDPTDLEGAAAHAPSWWRAVLAGPAYMPSLLVWAWRHGKRRDRRWIAIESLVIVAFFGAAVTTFRTTPAVAGYAVLVTMGAWAFPLLLVYIQHDPSGRTPLSATRAYRGRVLPALLLEHTYHLEHHLYPAVPGHRWRELSRRLDPYLKKAGVSVIRIP
jgi:beta-carotene hydroxylase